MTDATDIKATIQAYLAHHTAGEIDAIVALFAPDAVAYDPVDQPPHVGTDALRAFFTASHELADSLVLTLTGPIRVTGNEAAFPMEVVTKIGDLRMAIDVIDVMTFDDDGLITEMRAYWNMADARTPS